MQGQTGEADPQPVADETGPGLRPGVRLAIDWGKSRIGVAACDATGLLCYPVETVPNGVGATARLRSLVSEYGPIEIVMGLPTDLRGETGVAATAVVKVAADLASELNVSIRLVDERLTTVTAARRLAEAGRGARARRGVIDQAAAVAILEQALEYERRTGRPAGKVVNTTHEDEC